MGAGSRENLRLLDFPRFLFREPDLLLRQGRPAGQL